MTKQYRKYLQEHASRLEKIARQKPGYIYGSFRLDDPKPNPPQHGHWWGDWVYDAYNFRLEHVPYYYIDLKRCGDSAQVLDWIFQVANKTWATPKILGDLAQALDDLLEPQANLCSFGSNKAMDVRKLLEARRVKKAA